MRTFLILAASALISLFFLGKSPSNASTKQFEKISIENSGVDEKSRIAEFEDLINGPKKTGEAIVINKTRNAVEKAKIPTRTPTARSNTTFPKKGSGENVKVETSKTIPEKKPSTSSVVVQYNKLFIDGKSTDSDPLFTSLFLNYYFKVKLSKNEIKTITGMFATFKGLDKTEAEKRIMVDGKIRRGFQKIDDDGIGSLFFYTAKTTTGKKNKVVKKQEKKYSNDPDEDFLMKEALRNH